MIKNTTLIVTFLFAITGCEVRSSKTLNQNNEQTQDLVSLPSSENVADHYKEIQVKLSNQKIVTYKEYLQNLPTESERNIASESKAEHDSSSNYCNNTENFVLNGSFEALDNRVGMKAERRLSSIQQSGWDVFNSLPTENLDQSSWELVNGTGIEIQGHRTVTRSPAGYMSIELDAHGNNSNSTMSQKIYLCKGKYSLTFLYYPRTKTVDDNIITVRLDEKSLAEANLINSREWFMITQNFTVSKDHEYDLTVAAGGLENTIGGLIDDIHITRIWEE